MENLACTNFCMATKKKTKKELTGMLFPGNKRKVDNMPRLLSYRSFRGLGVRKSCDFT